MCSSLTGKAVFEESPPVDSTHKLKKCKYGTEAAPLLSGGRDIQSEFRSLERQRTARGCLPWARERELSIPNKEFPGSASGGSISTGASTVYLTQNFIWGSQDFKGIRSTWASCGEPRGLTRLSPLGLEPRLLLQRALIYECPGKGPISPINSPAVDRQCSCPRRQRRCARVRGGGCPPEFLRRGSCGEQTSPVTQAGPGQGQGRPRGGTWRVFTASKSERPTWWRRRWQQQPKAAAPGLSGLKPSGTERSLRYGGKFFTLSQFSGLQSGDVKLKDACSLEENL